MVAPEAVAVPCAAAVLTATDVAVPPERFNVMGLPDELALTVTETAPAIGTAGLTAKLCCTCGAAL